MALPVLLGAESFEVHVKVSAAFVFLCIAEQKELSEILAFEEKFLPDCGSAGSIPKRISRPTQSSWNLNLTVAVDVANTALDALKAAHRAKTTIEVKVIENVITTGQSLTGFAYVETVTTSAGASGFVTCVLALRGDGDLNAAAVS